MNLPRGSRAVASYISRLWRWQGEPAPSLSLGKSRRTWEQHAPARAETGSITTWKLTLVIESQHMESKAGPIRRSAIVWASSESVFQSPNTEYFSRILRMKSSLYQHCHCKQRQVYGHIREQSRHRLRGRTQPRGNFRPSGAETWETTACRTQQRCSSTISNLSGMRLLGRCTISQSKDVTHTFQIRLPSADLKPSRRLFWTAQCPDENF
jgi:hypothetical protein